MIKDIVFDLGGVVVGRDYDTDGAQIAEFAFLQGDRPFPECWKRYDRGTGSRQEVIESVAAEFGISLQESEEKLDRLMFMFNEFPETVGLIKELSDHGYGIYALSNMPVEFYEHISKFEVFRYFDGAVISSAEKMVKPEPAFFDILTKRYGLRPETTLFVDDKPSNTNAALKLGFNVCCFVPGEEGCDSVRAILSDRK